MTAAALAGFSGALAVAATWDVLGQLQSTATRRWVTALLTPVRGALAGQEPTTAERRRLALVSALTLLAAGYLVAGVLPALLVATIAPAVINQALRMSRERWRADLGRGAPPAARAIADALSGGHSTLAAIMEAARNGGVPGAAGRELRVLSRALALGDDQDLALTALARRAQHPAWDAIATAVALQRRTGGDLAALLRRIADVADERERVDADARGLTAQARFTARLVAGMPIVGLALTATLAPDAGAAMLSEPLSVMLLMLAALILVASLLSITRIARSWR